MTLLAENAGKQLINKKCLSLYYKLIYGTYLNRVCYYLRYITQTTQQTVSVITLDTQLKLLNKSNRISNSNHIVSHKFMNEYRNTNSVQ